MSDAEDLLNELAAQSEEALGVLAPPPAKRGRRKKEPPPEPEPEPPYPDPPAGLSERSARLWAVLGPIRATTEARRVLFEETLRCLDRLLELREILAREGLMTVTARSGVSHLHPALKAEAETRKQFTNLWDRLGLTRVPSIFENFGEVT